MRVACSAVLLLLSVAACGKRSAPPPAKETEAPKVERRAATPPGVIGCGNFRVAMPNESRTDYVYLQIDGERLGRVGRWDLAHPSLAAVATLEVYASPVTGEAYCTDMGTETQRPAKNLAVAGKVSFERKDDLVHVVIENARFVDADGRIREVARRECSNVLVGWLPG